MDKVLAVFAFLLAFAVMIVALPEGPVAVLFCSILALIAVFIINKTTEGEEKVFLRRLFIIGLLLRVMLATAIFVFGLQLFMGPDALSYDKAGQTIVGSWMGYKNLDAGYLEYVTNPEGGGFGMMYTVAGIYFITGTNPLAIQLFITVLGAATPCFIYVCTKKIFANTQVARTAAILVGVFPSMILWSSQALKDGIIYFLLVMSMSAVLSLQKKINYRDMILLLIGLMGIYTVRFYIFFAFAAAIFGAFFVNTQKSAKVVMQQVAVLIVMTLALTYFGVFRSAAVNIDRYGSLDVVQASRQDASRSAESGFAADVDVSTPMGVVQALPIGLAYLMLAPFPWQIGNFRQAITLPEVLIWWAMIPLLGIGLWYTLKNRWRESLAVILLTLMLTLVYAIFQGNVGTAYRMRAQMQIFYFIFIAVGLTLWREKRENQKLKKKAIEQMYRKQALVREQNSI